MCENVNVNEVDVVRFAVPMFDVVLLPGDVEEDVKVVLAIVVVVLLVDDVDKVDGQDDVDVLGFPQFFVMWKVMLMSSCVTFSRMFFSLMLRSLVKLPCMLSIMMLMSM